MFCPIYSSPEPNCRGRVQRLLTEEIEIVIENKFNVNSYVQGFHVCKDLCEVKVGSILTASL